VSVSEVAIFVVYYESINMLFFDPKRMIFFFVADLDFFFWDCRNNGQQRGGLYGDDGKA